MLRICLADIFGNPVPEYIRIYVWYQGVFPREALCKFLFLYILLLSECFKCYPSTHQTTLFNILTILQCILNKVKVVIFLPVCVIFSLEHTFLSPKLFVFEFVVFVLLLGGGDRNPGVEHDEFPPPSPPCNNTTSLNITEDLRRLFGGDNSCTVVFWNETKN